jgi:hypothetical protein
MHDHMPRVLNLVEVLNLEDPIPTSQSQYNNGYPI